MKAIDIADRIERLSDDQRAALAAAIAAQDPTSPQVDVSQPASAGRLIAYIVSNDAFDPQAFNQHLKDSLPPHLIPSQIIQLDSLPRSVNGKIDRDELAKLNVQSTEATGFSPASNEVQQKLASVFANVLGLQRVSIDDDYFQLGGDSLKLIRLVARAAAVWNSHHPQPGLRTPHRCPAGPFAF